MSQQQQLTLLLRVQTQKAQVSAVGVDQYDGGEAFEAQGNRMVATFMSTTQTVNGVTDAHNLNTGMFDQTLFFIANAQPHGHGGGTPPRAHAPENIRLQGAVDFEGRQPPTPNQPRDLELVIGSVSAASPAWEHLIGKQFRLERIQGHQGGQGGQVLTNLRLIVG